MGKIEKFIFKNKVILYVKPKKFTKLTNKYIMAENKKEKIDMANFDWAKLEEEIRSDDSGKKYMESDKEKFQRKVAENPWVPFGATATTGILILGLISFATKRTRYSQLLMRARIVAQGGTVFALLAAVLKSAHDDQQKKIKSLQSATEQR